MRKKYTLLILFLAGMSMGMKAQSKTVNVLYLDGTAHKMAMSEIERIEIGTGQINVVPTNGTAQTHLIGSIDRIVLDGNGSSAINAATTSTMRISADAGCIRIEGAADGTAVELFNAGGQQTARTTVSGGTAIIATGNLATGAYIIKAGDNTYKFIVK